MLRLVAAILVLTVLVTVSVLGFRGMTGRQPPLQAFDDMVDQPKYRPQAQSAFFGDGRTMRLPPAGTVAWGRSTGDRDEALRATDARFYGLAKMPVRIDRPLILRGQKLFNVECSVCHGQAGNGKGVVPEYGTINPPTYHSDRLRGVTDGYLYQIITQGLRVMPAYGPNVKPADRWAIIAYVRVLQRANHATLQDVPPDQRGRLGP